jgi:protein arginine kinase activator
MGKVCQYCSKREAKIHFTEIKDGKKTEMHICEQCAHDKTMAIAFPSLLGTIVKGGGPAVDAEAIAASCPRCGLAYTEFKAKGRLGCPQCYGAFAPVLATLLEKVHGARTHRGKAPHRVTIARESESAREVAAPEESVEIADLEEQLADAIRDEQYEKAAKLRDQIREMRGKPE